MNRVFFSVLALIALQMPASAQTTNPFAGCWYLPPSNIWGVTACFKTGADGSVALEKAATHTYSGDYSGGFTAEVKNGVLFLKRTNGDTFELHPDGNGLSGTYHVYSKGPGHNFPVTFNKQS